ncbi:MAG: hypothetical protein IPJ36_12605 [Simplicispira sp.]|nr:hypothetical protein [Simplicispira sp.]
MAQAAGANYAPRLAGAVGATGRSSVLERVYKFPAGEQISIFQSAPLPAGSANAVAAYSPCGGWCWCGGRCQPMGTC